MSPNPLRPECIHPRPGSRVRRSGTKERGGDRGKWVGSWAVSATIESEVSLKANRHGATQLQRRWNVPNAKAAVLVVHGIGEHSGRYEHVGGFLASNGYDVMAFDQRGFGQSAGIRAYVESFDDFLEDVEDLLAERRELGVPVVLLGHSLGGLISATYLVSDRPQPDLGILSAPALDATIPKWKRVAAPLMGRLAPKLFIPDKIEGAVLSRDVAVQEAYLNDPLVIAGSTSGLGSATLTAMEATSANIAKIRVPTYVLHGDADELVPPSASEAAGALPNVTRRLWPGLRHEAFNEPEQLEVMSEMEQWLSEQLSS